MHWRKPLRFESLGSRPSFWHIYFFMLLSGFHFIAFFTALNVSTVTASAEPKQFTLLALATYGIESQGYQRLKTRIALYSRIKDGV